MMSYLDTAEWKADHRPDGISYIEIPCRIQPSWILGPMSRETCDWLMDAIRRKQDDIEMEKEHAVKPPRCPKCKGADSFFEKETGRRLCNDCDHVWKPKRKG